MVFVLSPKGMDCRAQGRPAHPVIRNTQTQLFPEGDASMDLRRESANLIVRVDRTLSGYKRQRWPSYTGLRCATLCFAIQPLRGKDKAIPAAAIWGRPPDCSLVCGVIRMLLATCFAVTLVGTAHAQTRPKEKEDPPPTTAQRWLQDYFLKQAEKYEFFHDEARTNRLTLVQKPIFRWKQDDDWLGDLFVWTHLGRPEVVGCILASSADAGTRTIAHEFHTLALQALPRAKTVGGAWQPQSGLKTMPFPETEPPAKTAALRLAQMRTLARDFNAVMKHEDKDWELRWLPQPIYRYSAPDAGVIDGALFAYVWTRGTDPELLMMVECRDDQPQPRWTYAPVEFTTRSIRLTWKEREVWTTAGGGGWITGESTKPYDTFLAGTVSVPADNP